MKIGIDTFGCDHGRSGIGSYLASIVPCLDSSDEIKYMLYGSELDRYTYTAEKEMEFLAVDVQQSLNAERIWHLFGETSFIKKQHCDAVLYPAAARILPLRYACPSVAVVNDVLSDYQNTQEDSFYKRVIKFSLSHASAIIAPSNFIRDDLVRLGIKSSKIHVIHNGINHAMFYQRDMMDSEIVDIKPFAIKRPYIIYASSMNSASKKHIELIEAFAKFKERTHLPHKLVISGSDGSATESIHQAALRSNIASEILMTGYFPHESLPELYACADACIFPSASEGVGLPVLEAMATGLAVACASRGALPEITGNNAVFFDPDNIDEMSYCIEKVLTNKEIREKIIADGLEWVKQYNWKTTAEKTLELLKSIVK